MQDYRRQLVTDHRELAIKTLKDLEEQYFDAVRQESRLGEIIRKHFSYLHDLSSLFDTYIETWVTSESIKNLADDEESDAITFLRERTYEAEELPGNLDRKFWIACWRHYRLNCAYRAIQDEIRLCEQWRRKAEQRVEVLDTMSTTIAVPLA